MSLFHSPEFVRLASVPNLELNGCTLLIGPHAGTYGGFSNAEDLNVMESLVDATPVACTVKLAPASHDLRLFSRSMNVLHRAGFMLEYADLNYGLAPRSLDFNARIDRSQRKKLAKCYRAGYESVRIENLELMRSAYDLICANRRRAGLELSLHWKNLRALETALPGTYRFYATFDGDRMIAAAICVMIEADILYIYAWGDAEKNEYAPTVQLCEAIYTDACLSGMRLLDAGISTERGIPNYGLIRFKESLGFVPSLKATMARR